MFPTICILKAKGSGDQGGEENAKDKENSFDSCCFRQEGGRERKGLMIDMVSVRKLYTAAISLGEEDL